jgi:hypothetical protein
MWALWILIGMIIELSIGLIIFFIKKKSKTKYIRRGIIMRQYQVSNLGVKTSEFECQLEIGELERTDKKSKVEIITYIPSGTQHSSEADERKVRKLVDKSWIDSSEVEWITESLSDQRNQKLNQILN